MICYELFEGRKPFSEMNASAAARAASLFDRRPPWGKVNRSVFSIASDRPCLWMSRSFGLSSSIPIPTDCTLDCQHLI